MLCMLRFLRITLTVTAAIIVLMGSAIAQDVQWISDPNVPENGLWLVQYSVQARPATFDHSLGNYNNKAEAERVIEKKKADNRDETSTQFRVAMFRVTMPTGPIKSRLQNLADKAKDISEAIKKGKDILSAEERKLGDTLKEYATQVSLAYQRAVYAKKQLTSMTGEISKKAFDDANRAIEQYNQVRTEFSQRIPGSGPLQSRYGPMLAQRPVIDPITPQDLKGKLEGGQADRLAGVEQKRFEQKPEPAGKWVVWVYSNQGGQWVKQEDRTLATDNQERAQRYLDESKSQPGMTATSNLPAVAEKKPKRMTTETRLEGTSWTPEGTSWHIIVFNFNPGGDLQYALTWEPLDIVHGTWTYTGDNTFSARVYRAEGTSGSAITVEFRGKVVGEKLEVESTKTSKYDSGTEARTYVRAAQSSTTLPREPISETTRATASPAPIPERNRKTNTFGAAPYARAQGGGIILAQSNPGTPAAGVMGGLEYGDVILSINGKPVNTIEEYFDAVWRSPDYMKFTFRNVRNGVVYEAAVWLTR